MVPGQISPGAPPSRHDDLPVVGLEPHLASAEASLGAEFHDVPLDVIHMLVERECGNYAGARVRDYLPLLVARSVRNLLRANHGTVHLT